MANYAPTLTPVPAHYTRVPTLAQGGTSNGSGAAAQEEEKMWETALNQTDDSEDDRWLLDAVAENTNGILAFTGLLSATVAAFIIEFYKTLSPDSGDQTVALLGQISQQLTNSRNGTSTTATDQQFSPSVYMIWVNALWLISLVFSITSALIMLLSQGAVRRYVEMRKVLSKPNDRAHVRLNLLRGIKLYKLRLAIMAAPTLLHLSIFLFFGGLVIVFHTIYEKVAIAVDVAVGVPGLVYMAMSLLPLLDSDYLYRTPITFLLLYLWHTFLSLVYFGRLLFAKQLPGCSCLCPCPRTSLVSLDSDDSDKPNSSDGAGLAPSEAPTIRPPIMYMPLNSPPIMYSQAPFSSPSVYREAPSVYSEPPSPREPPFVHHEGPSPPPPGPRPRRAARSSVTHPPLVTPSPRAVCLAMQLHLPI